jgi:hypothetical protein
VTETHNYLCGASFPIFCVSVCVPVPLFPLEKVCLVAYFEQERYNFQSIFSFSLRLPSLVHVYAQNKVIKLFICHANNFNFSPSLTILYKERFNSFSFSFFTSLEGTGLSGCLCRLTTRTCYVPSQRFTRRHNQRPLL